MSKVIRIPDEIYDALNEIRWVERKSSLGEVIHQLLSVCANFDKGTSEVKGTSVIDDILERLEDIETALCQESEDELEDEE